MKTLMKLLAICLMSGLAIGFAQAKPEAADDPQAVIKQTIDRMLEMLEAHRSEWEKSPGKIYGVVEKEVVPKFDFERISRYVLGRYWRRATPEQRKAFTDEFKNLLIRTYATSILNYNGQKIKYLSVRQGKNKDRVTVMTEVREVGGPRVPINYRMHRSHGKWRVYDVVIDGVSLVSNYRKNFANKIRRTRLDGLIAQLKQKNTKGM